MYIEMVTAAPWLVTLSVPAEVPFLREAAVNRNSEGMGFGDRPASCADIGPMASRL